MTTITLTPDIERPIADAARKQGTTPELLALDSLRQLFLPLARDAAAEKTLFDFLGGHIGTIAGSSEALSENCGQRFADGLAEKHRVRQ